MKQPRYKITIQRKVRRAEIFWDTITEYEYPENTKELNEYIAIIQEDESISVSYWEDLASKKQTPIKNGIPQIKTNTR